MKNKIKAATAPNKHNNKQLPPMTDKIWETWSVPVLSILEERRMSFEEIFMIFLSARKSRNRFKLLNVLIFLELKNKIRYFDDGKWGII